ncbi:ABC transporter substrate-binding protein [Nocardia sp. FBN12]|uniref:ABC transporter substrate-binding protein n=1 Tax=Nocardia sp. FBN12 TaxID=3419766 RepID=UPI003D017DD8
MSADHDNDGPGIELPRILDWRTRFRLWAARQWPKLAVGLVVALVAGYAVYRVWPENTCGASDSGVQEIDGQCVGVTDGTYAFHESLAGVQRKIAEENARVSGSGHTVTVALLDSLTVDKTSAITLEMVRNELEGAYTAQYRINHTKAVGDQQPLVKLVLANWGSHQLQWEPVVGQLEAMVGGPEPLVAVTGLRVSTVQTELAAQRLAQRSIPIVSSIATADQLNYGAIRGFVRASPPNLEYAEALHGYLGNHPDLESAMLVYDLNSDLNPDPEATQGTDLFTKSLRDDMNARLADLIKYPPQGYVGLYGQTAASPNLFSNIVQNVCAVKPEVVAFAGRVVDFSSFLESMFNRVCPDSPITIVAAGADFGVLDLRAEEAVLRAKNIRVVYATETDPQGWIQNSPSTPPFFREFHEQFQQLGFASVNLNDGGAIATHDAILIAAKAARLSARAQSDYTMPTHLDVLNQMLNLNSLDEVPGAGGQLSFSYRGENSGNPSNKPVPVIEIPSAAIANTAEVHRTK